MGEEYRRWLEAHPNATKEEKQKALEDYMKKQLLLWEEQRG